MLKIFKNKIFFFKAVTKKKKKKHYNIFFMSLKQNKKRLLLLILENTGDRVFSASKTKMPTEYREKCIRCFKN